MVDLPGFGFAKRSKSERAKWQKMIRSYLLNRPNLLTVFILIDLRHEPQSNDLEFMEWLAVSEIPFTMLFTKADKLKKLQKEKHFDFYRKSMAQHWAELPNMIITSATEKTGRDAVMDYIEKTNKVFK